MAGRKIPADPDVIISVIIPAHNPNPQRLQRTLFALRQQTLPAAQSECLLIDNASSPPLQSDAWAAFAPENFRVIREAEPGLSHARRRGFAEAKAEIAVLVDDDNELAPDYLMKVRDLFSSHPKVGVLGGKSRPEFEVAPPNWTVEFHPLLALRDLGNEPLISAGLRPSGGERNEYPVFAPIGAGMAIRRSAWSEWMNGATSIRLSDRKGMELTSAGDNDIVLCAMRAGWEAAYFPSLCLQHLIHPTRLEPGYLARLNRGIQKSWMQVLTLHDANPWPPLTRASSLIRQFKAWFSYRAWRSPAAHIRWQGACGHFEGRIPS